MIAVALADLPPMGFETVWRTKLTNVDSFSGKGRLAVDEGKVFSLLRAFGAAPALAAFDAQTGRALWQRSLAPGSDLRIVVGNGRTVLVGEDELWEIDPRDGTTAWHLETSPDAIGPFLVGDDLIVESTWGRLQSFDLHTHRPRWTLRYPVEIGGLGRRSLACVEAGILWAKASDDRILKVDLSDGRLLFAQPFREPLTRTLPLRDAVALCGPNSTETWRAFDGRRLWRFDQGFSGPVYASAKNELWTLRPGDGRLLRFRGRDGTLLDDVLDLGGRIAPRAAIDRYGDGSLVASSRGWVRLDASGHPLWTNSFFVPPESTAFVGKDIVVDRGDEIVRLRPAVVVGPVDPKREASRLAAKGSWSAMDYARLRSVGHRAVPILLAALKRSSASDEDPLRDELLRIADARDTDALFPLADRAGCFSNSQERWPKLFRAWVVAKADPDELAEKLWPRLVATSDPWLQARLAGLIVRSTRPAIVAGLRARLLDARSPLPVRAALYQGLAASHSSVAVESVLALRRSSPSPIWEGVPPPAPSTEVERVLAAAFDARMRFSGLTFPALTVVYGPNARPFRLTGWARTLKTQTRVRQSSKPFVESNGSPEVRFVPLDLDGTLVDFDSARMAQARLETVWAGEFTDERLTLRKFGDEWVVVSIETTDRESVYPGSFDTGSFDTGSFDTGRR